MRAAIILSLAVGAASAQPLRGGPDGFGYCYETTQDPGDTVRFRWIDPSAHASLGNWIPNDDDGWTGVTLPGGFPFYGDTLDSVNVCTNGFIEFPSTATAYLNQPLPFASVPNLVAVFWDDLSPTGTSSIRCGSVADPTGTVISWLNMVRYGTDDTLSVQALLAADGHIDLNYLRAPAAAGSATVGIQGHYGANDQYLQYVCDGTPARHVPENHTTVTFTCVNYQHDVGVKRILSPSEWVPVRAQLPVSAVVRNWGRETESFDVRALIVQSHYPYDVVFDQTSHITGLSPHDTAVCYFGDWLSPPSEDSWIVTVATQLCGDLFGGNDTLHGRSSSVPPPFGTVLASWDLRALGDGMNLTGIAHSADSNRFYICAVNPNRVLSFPPAGPDSGLRTEPFALQNFFGDDLTWGIAWDPTLSSCWLGHVSAFGSGCALARYAADGSFTGDTWDLTGTLAGAWLAGIDIGTDGICRATSVGNGNNLYELDPASHTVVRTIPGPAVSYRACSYIGISDCYIISGGWNQGQLARLDQNGHALELASLPDLADLDVYMASRTCQESLVWAFATTSSLSDRLCIVSVGRTWAGAGLLEPVAKPHGRAQEPSLSVTPNPARGHVQVSLLPPVGGLALELIDIAGRVLRSVKLDRDGRAVLAGPAGLRLPPGVYVLSCPVGPNRLRRRLTWLGD